MNAELTKHLDRIRSVRRLILVAICVMTVSMFVTPYINSIGILLSIYLSTGSYISLGKTLNGKTTDPRDILCWLPLALKKVYEHVIKKN